MELAEMKRTTIPPVQTQLRLIYAMSHSFRRSTGMDMDELVGEASLAFVEACVKWNPDKSSLSTFSRMRMTQHLADWLDVQREKRRHEKAMPEGVEEDDEDPLPLALHLTVSPERLVDFKQRLNMGSRDCRALCRIIFQSPAELMDMAKSRKAKGWLKRTLRQLNWSWPRIWKAFREIENIVDGATP